MKHLNIIVLLLCFVHGTAQIKMPGIPDSLQKVYKQRKIILISANVAVTAGSLYFLYNEWYKGYPSSPFHFFNDNDEWLQVDKAGHFYSAYTISRISAATNRWAGLDAKKSDWLGAAAGLGYMTIIELFDGVSSQWGFSWGDYVSNIAGSAAYLSQQLAWKEQRIQIKFSTHINDYSAYGLNNRADSLYGTTFFSRVLKDYNAQTYWASINVRSFFKQSNWPSWLNIAVGYGAEGMFGASSNIVKDKNDHIVFDRSDIARYRQFYIAPDIDLTKVKTKSKFLKSTFSLLNALKFPAPSIEFSQGSVKWNWISF